jgi:small subunit ribosomal protein S16
MDEPKEGATTMKKKAQEKLAAKANPAPVSDVVVEEAPQADVISEETPVVSEPTATDVVAEVPAEPVTSEEAAE